jgi:hypothetical protein
MESNAMRGDVLDFAQACERLDFAEACETFVGFVREHHGLTTLERDTVINAVRAMDGEVRTLAMLKNARESASPNFLSNGPPDVTAPPRAA